MITQESSDLFVTPAHVTPTDRHSARVAGGAWARNRRRPIDDPWMVLVCTAAVGLCIVALGGSLQHDCISRC